MKRKVIFAILLLFSITFTLMISCSQKDDSETNKQLASPFSTPPETFLENANPTQSNTSVEFDWEKLKVTKKEIISRLYDNYEVFSDFVEYLKSNPMELFCYYNSGIDTFYVSVNDMEEFVEIDINDEILSGVKKYIEVILVALEFEGVEDFSSMDGSVSINFNSGALSRGIWYSETELEELNTFTLRRSRINENWYYWEASH